MSYAIVKEPFGYTEIDPAAAEQIVELGRLDSEGAENPHEAARIIARTPDGKLLVADVSGTSIVQVGEAVTFEDAATIATAIIAGEPRVLMHPGATKGLAVAFLAAWCMAGRRAAMAEKVAS